MRITKETKTVKRFVFATNQVRDVAYGRKKLLKACDEQLRDCIASVKPSKASWYCIKNGELQVTVKYGATIIVPEQGWFEAGSVDNANEVFASLRTMIEAGEFDKEIEDVQNTVRVRVSGNLKKAA